MMSTLIRVIGVMLLCMIHFITKSQNLCPNPGFEQISACPTGAGELNLASPWSGAGSPTDLFQACHVNTLPLSCNAVNVPNNFAGNSSPFAGNGYAGFYTYRTSPNQRTYLQVPLTSPMLSGQLYRLSFYTKRSSFSGYATNGIGIALSTSAISQTGGNNIAISNQYEHPDVIADTSAWTQLTGFYTAAGGELYLTAGNFKNDASTTIFNFPSPAPFCAAMSGSAFYYADNFSVTAINEQLSISGDTVICFGESTTLTGITNTEGWWSLASTPNDTIAAGANTISISPPTTTAYIWHGIQGQIQVTVLVTSAATVSLPSDTTICSNQGVTLNALSGSSSYLWSTGATTPQITVSLPGIYVVSVNNGACIVRDTCVVDTIGVTDLNIPSSARICPDQSEFIILDAGAGLSYQWSPTGDTSQTILVQNEGIYTVTVIYPGGCTVSASTEVTELCEESFYIPSAFTPNNDGKNDLFYGSGTNLTSYQIRIFNRWGQLMHESDVLGPGGGWNGKINDATAQSGIYVYLLSYEFEISPGKFRTKTRKGYFTLTR
jgi:gliding motility-associated-like protein